MGTWAQRVESRDEAIESQLHISDLNRVATFGLVAINIVIFLLMALDGAGIFASDPYVHISWGSNFSPLTLSGDGWRLISSLFIHFGFLHLFMNMCALLAIGSYIGFITSSLGLIRYLVAYFCAGVLGNLASLWWHASELNGAGASGAIFGVYGLFAVVMFRDYKNQDHDIYPWEVKAPFLVSALVFIVANLFTGLRDNVDTAGHIGGLLGGAIIGSLYCVSNRQRWIVPAVVLATAAVTYSYLHSHTVSQEHRKVVLAELKEARSSPDYVQFNEKFDEVLTHDGRTTSPENVHSYDEYSSFAKSTAYPAWDKADQLIAEMEHLNISDRSKAKLSLLKEYIANRRLMMKLYILYLRREDESVGQLFYKAAVKNRELVEKLSALED